jgi:hypothetical protein
MTILEHLRAGGQVQTQEGGLVTIYTTEHTGRYPIVGRVGDNVTVTRWSNDGRWISHEDGSLDLVPVPRKFTHELWVNVGPNKKFTHHTSAHQAQRVRESDCIACVKVIVEGVEGEGL